MKFVSSNDSSTVEETVKEAIDNYQDASGLSDALKTLAKLKGIGPATASLLLAVHYPKKILFFSDEAYYWLCNKGQKTSLKYNMKEYDALNNEAEKLMKKLSVSAMDVEKVAYVLLKQEGHLPKPTSDDSTAKTAETSPKKPKESVPAKRKKSSDDMIEDKVPVRRSKRGKVA